MIELFTQLEDVLNKINEQIREMEEFYGEDTYKMRRLDGTPLMSNLLIAKAEVLCCIAEIRMKASIGVLIEPPRESR